MHRIPLTGPLLAAILALAPAAHPQGSQKSVPARAAAPAATAIPAAGTAAAGSDEAQPAPNSNSQAVDEKFRRLQKEMARDDRGFAASPGATAPSPAPEPVGAVSLSLQVLFGLAFVLILAVFSIRLLKRFQGRLFSRPHKAGGDLLEVMETCHLGQNQRVVALRINDEVGVLGVTPHGISLLTVLKQPAGEIRAQRIGNAEAFSDNLNKLLDRFKKPKRVSDLLDGKA